LVIELRRPYLSFSYDNFLFYFVLFKIRSLFEIGSGSILLACGSDVSLPGSDADFRDRAP
jgi:hypothetical protein